MGLPPILRLPDEILFHIFSFASQTAPSPRSGRLWDHRLPSVVLKISLTCSCFQRISRSFIFESIHIKERLPSRHARESALPAVHARLRDEPELRPSCTRLQLDIQRMSRNHYVMGYFAPGKQPDGSSVSSHDDNAVTKRHDMWALIELVNRHMRNLELLRCYDQWGYGCRGSDLISNIDIPSLKELQIVGIARSVGPSAPNKQRTAAFTSLTLSIHDETQNMVSQFISWPKELTDFHLRKCWNQDIYHINMPMVQSWLSIHKTTLKHIAIHEVSFQQAPEGPLGFDATDFTSLELLHLSRWLWHRSLDVNLAKAEAELLLAPKLRKFVWDFTATGDGFREFWTDFDAEEEEWLGIFVEVAISRRDRHCLEEIYIQFTPEDMGWGRQTEVYPWDRIDRVRDKVVQLSGGSMTLTYNEPVFSREDWIAHLESRGGSDMES